MVNPAHRMRKLQTLLHIRLGPGAAKLPSNISKIHLDIGEKIENGHKGPKQFWRQMLPRLKYHNPQIPMTVRRHTNQSLPAMLKIHTSQDPVPISLRISNKSETEILETFLQTVGGAEEVKATEEELEMLRQLEEQKERAMLDSERGKRERAQMKKQEEMLAMASQGAV